MTKERAKTGPKAERLTLKGNWEKLVGTALAKKRPEGGWPKVQLKKRKAGKTR